MRQPGIIAAAGIMALTEMVDRLAEDHANARALAVGLAQTPGLDIDPERVTTNIVYFRVVREGVDASSLAARLAENGVLVLPTAPDRMRAVLNYHVTGDDVGRALRAFRKTMEA
jgi:threonine aldolase